MVEEVEQLGDLVDSPSDGVRTGGCGGRAAGADAAVGDARERRVPGEIGRGGGSVAAHGMGQGARPRRGRIPPPNLEGTFAWLLSDATREEMLFARRGYFRLHAVSRLFSNLRITCICGNLNEQTRNFDHFCEKVEHMVGLEAPQASAGSQLSNALLPVAIRCV
jgi:hypothetical protein